MTRRQLKQLCIVALAVSMSIMGWCLWVAVTSLSDKNWARFWINTVLFFLNLGTSLLNLHNLSRIVVSEREYGDRD